jgi:RND family efflux transporter MFP subunit
VDGPIVAYRKEKIEVGVALSDEAGFPHGGVIDFADNHVNERTGTIRVRALLPNSDKLLTPGLYCRIRFPVGKPHKATLVPEEAIGSDQGQKFVFLVNDKSEVVYRKVTLGAAVGTNRVILAGVTTSDKVIVTGVQRVREGTKVTAKPAEHPASESSAGPTVNTTAAGGR